MVFQLLLKIENTKQNLHERQSLNICIVNALTFELFWRWVATTKKSESDETSNERFAEGYLRVIEVFEMVFWSIETTPTNHQFYS